MLTKFQKSAIFSIIFCLIFGLIFNIFITKPKQVQALDGGAGFMTVIKETVLDAVGWAVTDQVLKPLKQKIIDWGMGKTTDSNEPFFVLDWKKFFNEALDVASGRFIGELKLTKLCAPFSATIGGAVGGLGLTTYYTDQPKYKDYAACTIDRVVDNATAFFENPSISVYGWDTWTALSQPNNNFLGSYLLATARKSEIAQEETTAADKQTATSGGTKNQTTTTQTDTDACKEACIESSAGDADKLLSCRDDCDTTTKGVTLQSTVKNLGKDINTQISQALGADMSRIISADEITELLGVFFSSLLNKAVDGLGLVPSTTNTTSTEQNRNANRDLYAYGPSAEKAVTPEMQKDVYTNVLNGMLKGVQMISRATAKCDTEDTMLTDLDFNKSISDVYSAQLEALYVGTTGVALKPDYTVLDSAYAPSSLYGYRWGEIPSEKIPPKCKKIITQASLGQNTTCKDIVSGLEPSFSSQCKQCIYDENELNCPPAPYPPVSDPATLTKPIVKAKQDFYNSCMSWYDITKNRCSDCIKTADEKCQQDDLAQKQDCIENACNNYKDLQPHITSTISSGVNFHDKCLIEESKTSCFTCLKEYYMPASYCDNMTEFTARALIKYPAVVLQTDVNDGRSIGRYDSSFQDAYGTSATECNNDEGQNKPIDLSLICRIMPDFEDGGVKVCQKYCMNNGVTEAELNDIVDNRPTNEDCNNKKLFIGGRINVWNVVANGAFQQLSKCCAATNTTDKKRYQTCLGASTQQPCTFAKPVNQEPWCYCNDGYRPLGFGRTGDTGTPPGSKAPMGGDCHNINVQADGNPIYIYSNTGSSANPATDMLYFGGTGCIETNEAVNNNDRVYDPTCKADPSQCQATDAIPGTGALWSQQGPFKGLIGINVSAGTYNAGVYHADNTTVTTGVHVCTQCNSSDSQYPYYGTEFDQCTGKIE